MHFERLIVLSVYIGALSRPTLHELKTQTESPQQRMWTKSLESGQSEPSINMLLL